MPNLDLLRVLGHESPKETLSLESGREALRRENVRIQARIDAERAELNAPAVLKFQCPSCEGASIGDACDFCSGACVVTEAHYDDYHTRYGWPEKQSGPRLWLTELLGLVALWWEFVFLAAVVPGRRKL